MTTADKRFRVLFVNSTSAMLIRRWPPAKRPESDDGHATGIFAERRWGGRSGHPWLPQNHAAHRGLVRQRLLGGGPPPPRPRSVHAPLAAPFDSSSYRRRGDRRPVGRVAPTEPRTQ